jgi:hypothetical protein
MVERVCDIYEKAGQGKRCPFAKKINFLTARPDAPNLAKAFA